MGHRIRKVYHTKFSEEVKNEIIDFYRNEENSKTFSGMRDTVMQKVPGAPSIPMIKKVILYDLSVLYRMYKSQTLHEKIPCFSIFAKLRPKDCYFAGEPGTHSVCVCEDHENLQLKIAAIKPNIHYTEVIASGVCSIEDRNCMLHECKNCTKNVSKNTKSKAEVEILKYLTTPEDTEDVDHSSSITYSNWTTESISDKTSKSMTRPVFTSISEPYNEFIDKLSAEVRQMTKHHFLTQKTKEYLKQCKDNLMLDTGLIVCDFAENYKFLIQESIQAYYFSNKQASLFTAVLYYKDKDSLTNVSYCVVSDSTTHQAFSVNIFQEAILKHIKEKYSQIKNIIYFSDGAPTQFKNK